MRFIQRLIKYFNGYLIDDFNPYYVIVEKPIKQKKKRRLL